jgi:hypothetical protein
MKALFLNLTATERIATFSVDLTLAAEFEVSERIAVRHLVWWMVTKGLEKHNALSSEQKSPKLKAEAIFSSETLLITYHTTGGDISEVSNLNFHLREVLCGAFLYHCYYKHRCQVIFCCEEVNHTRSKTLLSILCCSLKC